MYTLEFTILYYLKLGVEKSPFEMSAKQLGMGETCQWTERINWLSNESIGNHFIFPENLQSTARAPELEDSLRGL